MKRKLQIASLTCIVLLMIITPLSLQYVVATSATPEALFGRRNRVLWDQSHGVTSGFNISGLFAPLASELSDAGFVVDSLNTGPVTFDVLKGYKIFVVCLGSNWYTPYTSGEVTAIVKAVKWGTSLLILGDNPACPNEIVNAVSQEFGVTFGVDETVPMSPIITNFAEHPVFSGVSKFYLKAGGTLDISGAATAIAWDDDQNVVAASYTRFHGFNKVVFIGDFSCFLNSYLYDYDNLLVALNLFNYLNQLFG